MRVSGAWIESEAAQRAISVLTDAGHAAYFVGGCVRNALLGAAVADVDIATDAHPETVLALAAGADVRAVPTGIDHGTVTLVIDHEPFEVTTFRRDVETFGRHAVVAYADTVDEDAHRRDFTMNALYACADGTLVDPLDGLPDLIARRVRFIDDAEMRIREDYLRILRFFRFTAWFGDPEKGIDAEGLAASAALADGITQLSRERVTGELVKLLSAPRPGPAVAAMAQAGVLMRTLPGADATALPVLLHLEAEAGLAPDPVRRLASLNAPDLGTALRLPKAAVRRSARIAEGARTTDGAAALGYRLGAPEAMDALVLRAAWTGTALPAGAQVAVAHGAGARLPVSAADLMPDHQGAALGARLKELEERWIASGFTLTKAQLLA